MLNSVTDTHLASADCVSCPVSDCALRHACRSPNEQKTIALDRGDRLEARDSGACLQFWTVVSGVAATCTVFADGRRQILGIESRGDIICSSLAGPGTQNWLEALGACEICQIDLSARADDLRDDTGFLASTFSIVHKRLSRAQSHISTLGRLDSQERVLFFLAETAFRSPGTPVTTLHMSREDIADYLGLNAETVSRILSRIRKLGLVKFLNRSDYIIPDIKAVGRRIPVRIPNSNPQQDLEIAP